MITENHAAILKILLGRKLTINQISKKSGLAYATAHSHVNELLEQEIITAERIGPSLLCRIDMTSDRTPKALSFIEYGAPKKLSLLPIYSIDKETEYKGSKSQREEIMSNLDKVKVHQGGDILWRDLLS